MAGVVVVYFGLCASLIALISLLRPLAFLGVRDRLTAVLLLGGGIIIVVTGAILPAGETRVTSPRTQLDLLMPVYQFSEFHSIRIMTSREHVYRGLQDVTPDEIFLYRTLVWLRRFGRPGPPSILNPPPGRPLLDVAEKTSFLTLAETPNEELVLGTLVAAPRGWRPSGKRNADGYKALLASGQPGFAFAMINFRLDDCDPASKPPCTQLTTETRIYATDPSTKKRFAAYWRVIYPGSSLIRSMWLRAIARRAA